MTDEVEVFEYVYKETQDISLRLKCYRPVNPSVKEYPAMLFFYGGGWVNSNIDQFRPQSEFFAKRDVLSFTAEYRVQSLHGTTPIECVQDGIDVLKWILSHATLLNIDPNRIVVAGGSAGGHVAASTVLFNSSRSQLSCVPKAMVLFNPVTDTSKSGYGFDFLGEQALNLSLIPRIRPGLPPTMIFHGTDDRTVPYANSDTFSKRMRQYGNICHLVPFRGKDHGFFNFGQNNNQEFMETMQQTEAFLEELGILCASK